MRRIPWPRILLALALTFALLFIFIVSTTVSSRSYTKPESQALSIIVSKADIAVEEATSAKYEIPEKTCSCANKENKNGMHESEFQNMKVWHPEIDIKEESFFLLETGNQSRGFYLNSRQACSIESTALANPNSEVYIFISSRTYHDDPLLTVLSEYVNIHFIKINIEKFVSGTPLEVLLTNGKLRASDFRKEHTSDVLRYTTLYRYSGTYLDLDFVVMKSLENMSNYAGAETKTTVAAGIMSFGADTVGRSLANECAESLARNFNGSVWRANGPDIIENIAIKRCNTTRTILMVKSRCKGFKVLPRRLVYAIYFNDWEMFFTEASVTRAMGFLRSSYAAHVWNKNSQGKQLKKTANVAYMILARKFCPAVYQNTEEYF